MEEIFNKKDEKTNCEEQKCEKCKYKEICTESCKNDEV